MAQQLLVGIKSCELYCLGWHDPQDICVSQQGGQRVYVAFHLPSKAADVFIALSNGEMVPLPECMQAVCVPWASCLKDCCITSDVAVHLHALGKVLLVLKD